MYVSMSARKIWYEIFVLHNHISFLSKKKNHTPSLLKKIATISFLGCPQKVCHNPYYVDNIILTVTMLFFSILEYTVQNLTKKFNRFFLQVITYQNN